MQVGAHAMLLLVTSAHSPTHLRRLCTSYSLFYVGGTSLAIMVPVVSWTPLISQEHLLPLAAFVSIAGVCLLQLCRSPAHAEPPLAPVLPLSAPQLRAVALALAVAVAVSSFLLGFVWTSRHFSPVTNRVRALFLQHTRTGNPLVDSVAEHSPTSPASYWRYLDATCYTAPAGAIFLLLRAHGPTQAASFVLLLGSATIFFSQKMSRLLVLIACPAAVLSGVAIGSVFDGCIAPVLRPSNGHAQHDDGFFSPWLARYHSSVGWGVRMCIAVLMVAMAIPRALDFYGACDNMARFSLSHPQVCLLEHMLQPTTNIRGPH